MKRWSWLFAASGYSGTVVSPFGWRATGVSVHRHLGQNQLADQWPAALRLRNSLGRSTVADNLKNQIAISGQAMCHSGVMEQVLREGIIGEATEVKYVAVLATFTTETKTKARMETTQSGVVFVFSPIVGTP